MATELTELAALAAENIARQRADESLQTFLDDWADRLETETMLERSLSGIDFPCEPRSYEDVVSWGQHAVVGFLVRKDRTDERIVFS